MMTVSSFTAAQAEYIATCSDALQEIQRAKRADRALHSWYSGNVTYGLEKKQQDVGNDDFFT